MRTIGNRSFRHLLTNLHNSIISHFDSFKKHKLFEVDLLISIKKNEKLKTNFLNEIFTYN